MADAASGRSGIACPAGGVGGADLPRGAQHPHPHPAYAGAYVYVYGRTRAERYVTTEGDLKFRRRRTGRDEWEVFLPEHHQGFLDWATFLTNQERIGRNIRPVAHQPGTGAVREGCALLQGLALCGVCGRKLAVYYDGRHRNTPGYYSRRHRPPGRRQTATSPADRWAGHRRHRRCGVPGRVGR